MRKIFTLIVLGCSLASCGQYICPTYSKTDALPSKSGADQTQLCYSEAGGFNSDFTTV